MPAHPGEARQREVERLALELCLQRLFAGRALRRIERCFDAGLDPVHRLARLGAIFGRQLAHPAQEGRERPFLAEEFDPQRFDPGLIRGGGDLSFRLGEQRFQFLEHRRLRAENACWNSPQQKRSRCAAMIALLRGPLRKREGRLGARLVGSEGNR
jgi:hypothetical protein